MFLDDTHRILRENVRKRMEQPDIKKMIARYERRRGPFAWEFVHAMAELGLCGINIPGAYGGAGADNRSGIIVMMEMSRIWAGGALVLAVGNSLAGYPLARWGSEEQKQRWLPNLAAGKILGCFALTESDVGSDASHIRTTAEHNGDGWRMSGEKHFITNSPVASFIVVFARTDQALQDHKGISAFVVPARPARIRKGTLAIGKPQAKKGLHAAHMAPIWFDQHAVSSSALLGQREKGFRVAMETLNHGRLWITAQAVGLLERAYELAKLHAERRITFGAPLITRQSIRHDLTKLACSLDAARLLLFSAGLMEDEGKEFAPHASLAKLFATEELKRLKGKAQDIHGGSGYLEEIEIGRIIVDGDVPNIYEGASNVQRDLILKAWLDGHLPLISPQEQSSQMLFLKHELQEALAGTSALYAKAQVLAFDVADLLPLIEAHSLVEHCIKTDSWPREFMTFQNPALLEQLLKKRIAAQMPKEWRVTIPLFDEAADHILL